MYGFDYDLLHALAAVVQEGSFDGAAHKLNITQSAVSQRIKHLEEREGAIVIVRGRPCRPTELGQELYKHAQQVQLLEHQFRRAVAKTSDQHGNQAVTIRIAVNTDSLSTWFPAVVQRAYEKLLVQLDIVADDQEHTHDKLTSGFALAAITSSEVPIQGFRRTTLGQMEYVAVATPEFVGKYFSNGITPDTIADAPLMTFDRKDTLPQEWLLSVMGQNVAANGHYMPSFGGYLECCLNGCGWGMMPKSTVVGHIKAGRLVELKPEAPILVPLHWQASTQSSEILRQLGVIVMEQAKMDLLRA